MRFRSSSWKPFMTERTTISAATPRAIPAIDVNAMNAAYYGIGHAANADCPLAPVRLAALGVDPGTAFWLAADPVTLVAGRNDVRLTGVVRDIDPYDAAALIRMLNANFVTDGIEFVGAPPAAW